MPTFTPPKGKDARHYDPVTGRFICNAEHRDTEHWACPHCPANWEQ